MPPAAVFPPALESLVIALGLGLLVGLQRERTEAHLAGIRTFALITVLGALSALLAREFGGWVIAGSLVALAAAIVIGNLAAMKAGVDARGITSEVAILVMFGVGAMTVPGPKTVAVAVGVATALLLHSKPVLHRFTERLGDEDVKGIMRFALISFIILPVVPDQTYGPFDVLNPRHIWLMVVLVVGMSLCGYIAYKFFGAKAGMLLGGLLGGLISSTATTVSHARQSKAGTDMQIRGAAVVIVLATAVLYFRLIVEISIAAPGYLTTMLPPVAALGGLSVVLAAAGWWLTGKKSDGAPPQQNPTQLKTALVFAVLYAAITFAVAAGAHYLGERGTYLVAAVSGVTEMDAITLSSSSLATHGKLSPTAAWRAIVIASVANLVFKFALAWTLGGRPLARRLALPFGVLAAVSIGVIFLWPTNGAAHPDSRPPQTQPHAAEPGKAEPAPAKPDTAPPTPSPGAPSSEPSSSEGPSSNASHSPEKMPSRTSRA